MSRIGAMNALLSITLSIAKEEANDLPGNLEVMPDDPIKIINKLLAEIQEWQDYFLDLAR